MLASRALIAFILFLCFVLDNDVQAQANQCTFKDPVITIDFGTSGDEPSINVFPNAHYRQATKACPDDGSYAYVSRSSGCHNNDWITFNGDHTAGDANGRLMIVNASIDAGVFFNTILSGLKANTTYELAAWMVNVCHIGGGCPVLPPNITMRLLTTSGAQVASFRTGPLTQSASPHWTRYAGMFTTSAATTLILTMEDVTTGGCGNDFAMDDITIRECIKPAPVVKQEERPAVQAPPVATTIKTPPPAKRIEKKQAPPIATPVVKTTPAKVDPAVKERPAATIEKTKNTPAETSTPIKQLTRPVLPLPKVIAERENPLVKQIQTTAGEIVIDLYDNGDIDGDTVSVYHNNELMISKALLSAKANSFTFKVDAAHPHHEIIMVADNLGSIPPNTSTMVINTKEKRYEVFISSSEEKNAKIVFDLR